MVRGWGESLSWRHLWENTVESIRALASVLGIDMTWLDFDSKANKLTQLVHILPEVPIYKDQMGTRQAKVDRNIGKKAMDLWTYFTQPSPSCFLIVCRGLLAPREICGQVGESGLDRLATTSQKKPYVNTASKLPLNCDGSERETSEPAHLLCLMRKTFGYTDFLSLSNRQMSYWIQTDTGKEIQMYVLLWGRWLSPIGTALTNSVYI